MAKQALVFGAGRIGRGFLAEIFADAGYALTFVEYDKNVCASLKKAGKYTIFKAISNDQIDEVVIQDFGVLHTDEKEKIADKVFSKGAILGIAVHQMAIPAICDILAPVIDKRAALMSDEGLDIILCVNMMHPAQHMRQELEKRVLPQTQTYLKEKVGLVDSVVMRMSPEASKEMLKKCPLAVLNSGYPEMPVDGKAFKGEVPQSKLLRLSQDIEAEEARKIYILNMAHAALAYLGIPKGYVWAADCVKDPAILRIVAQAMLESGIGLSARYGFSLSDMKTWNDNVLSSLQNRALGDKLDRLGADSRRKLGAEDRLVAPMKLCLQAGAKPMALCQILAAGYGFRQENDPGSEEVYQEVKTNGIATALKKYSGLVPGDGLYETVLQYYEQRKGDA